MKIVYCIAGTFNSGGMERVLAGKVNYLSECGYDVTIITTDQKARPSFFPLSRGISQFDLSINYEDNRNSCFVRKCISFIFKQYLHRRRLAKVLKTLHADVVVSMFCNEVNFLPYIKDGSKKVLEIHFSKYKRLQYDRHGIMQLVDRCLSHRDERLVKKYNKFVVLTKDDASLWGPLPNLVVIPNSIPFETTNMASLDSKTVLAVGRYDYQKGFDTLIEIWKKVSALQAGWVLRIVGEGELEDELRSMIVKNNLQDEVFLIPATLNIVEEYLNASILVMTSRYEGFGMVLLEAQTVGLPAVSFNCKCGPGDIIEDGVSGYLIPEGNKTMFADTLLKLMGDKEQRTRMGKKAKMSSARYSKDVVMKQWLSLFENLIDDKNIN